MDREERVRSRAEADDLAYRTVVFEFMLDAGDEGIPPNKPLSAEDVGGFKSVYRLRFKGPVTTTLDLYNVYRDSLHGRNWKSVGQMRERLGKREYEDRYNIMITYGVSIPVVGRGCFRFTTVKSTRKAPTFNEDREALENVCYNEHRMAEFGGLWEEYSMGRGVRITRNNIMYRTASREWDPLLRNARWADFGEQGELF